MGRRQENGGVAELLVLSGKGGTGKTSILGSFAALAENAVLADCDVDAANLHLLLSSEITNTHVFTGMPQPRIDMERCSKCGRCAEVCRFGAACGDGTINWFVCESCGVCSEVCSSGAIKMVEDIRGHWYEAKTRFGPLIYARLVPGEENSGLLVAEVKNKAREIRRQNGFSLLLADGPPGIGCPVISALPGADLVLLVTEPTLSGRHDLDRIIKLIKHFNVPAMVCINKWDLNPEMTLAIEAGCRENQIELAGRVPFDVKVTAATASRRPLVHEDGPAAEAILDVWQRVKERIQKVT